MKIGDYIVLTLPSQQIVGARVIGFSGIPPVGEPYLYLNVQYMRGLDRFEFLATAKDVQLISGCPRCGGMGYLTSGGRSSQGGGDEDEYVQCSGCSLKGPALNSYGKPCQQEVLDLWNLLSCAKKPKVISFPVSGDFRTPTVTLFWYVFVFRRPDGTEFEDTRRFTSPGPDPAMLQYESEQIKAGLVPLRLIEYTQDVEHT